MKFNAGFIYVAPNCDPKQQNAVIPGESIDLYVYGCSTYSQAEVVAKRDALPLSFAQALATTALRVFRRLSVRMLQSER